MKYRNYLFNPRYWVRGIRNPHVAWDNIVALVTPPFLYVRGATRVAGLIDQYVGTLLYESVLTCKSASQNVIEVGAFKGLSTVYLSLAASKIGKKVKSFEMFSGLPASHPDLDPSFHVGQFASEVSEYESNLKAYGKPDVVTLVIGDARETMLPTIGSEGFSLAFLDVDVWEVMRELLLQLLSIAKGGEIVIIHDVDSPGVRKALDEFHSMSHNRVMERKLHANTTVKLEFPRRLE